MVTSYPEGAKVKVNGIDLCSSTPCRVSIDRKGSSAIVSVEKEGYRPVTRDIPSTVNPWLFGNIFIGGVFGSTTDVVTGAAYKYESSSVHVELRQK